MSKYDFVSKDTLHMLLKYINTRMETISTDAWVLTDRDKELSLYELKTLKEMVEHIIND